ncbi:MAG: hypothetical protein AAFY71_19165 [Bacteroidota bacterium]
MLFAEYKCIGVVILSEIGEKDQKEQVKNSTFEVGTLLVSTAFERRRPKILSIEFEVDNRTLKAKKPDLLVIRFKDGKVVPLQHYITSFWNTLHQGESGQLVEEYNPCPNAHVFNRASKEETPIKGINLIGKLIVVNENEERHINIVDQVWMHMKALLEDHSYTKSRTGMVKKDGS